MTTVAQIRQGIATRLATIDGLNAYAVQPNLPMAPAAIVAPVGVAATDEVLGSGTIGQHLLEIIVIVSKAAGLPVAQNLLDDYTSPTGARSIRAALVADRTLGGVAITTYFEGWDRPDDEEQAGVDYLSQRLTVRVWVT